MWSGTTNEFAPLIAAPQWVSRPDRDIDLSLWDPSNSSASSWDFAFQSAPGRQSRSHEESAPPLPCEPKHPHDASHRGCASFCQEGSRTHCSWCKCAGCGFCESSLWQHKEAIAVFRGALHRLNVYSARWREQGPRRTPVTPANWQHVGRTALIARKASEPSLYNLNLSPGGAPGHSDGLQMRMQIPDETWRQLDEPVMLSYRDQVSRFKYTINVEGHGGWADRLYKLLLSPQLVFMQDMPARLWYEASLQPWVHYVPIDSSLRNLSDAIRWAQQHDKQAKAMVKASNALIRKWLSTAAIFRYEEELLLGYAQLLEKEPILDPRAIRFTCEPSTESVSCLSNLRKNHLTSIKSTRCFFNAVEKNRYFEAGSILQAALMSSDTLKIDLRTTAHSSSVLQSMSSSTGHREPLDAKIIKRFARAHQLEVGKYS